MPTAANPCRSFRMCVFPFPLFSSLILRLYGGAAAGRRQAVCLETKPMIMVENILPVRTSRGHRCSTSSCHRCSMWMACVEEG